MKFYQCKECNNSSTCLHYENNKCNCKTCNSGYYLIDGNCKDCDNNCQTCQNSATNICEENDVLLVTRIEPGKTIISKIRTAINQDIKIVKKYH